VSAAAPPRAYSALLALSVIWGYSWIVAKVALNYSGPFEFAALRTLLATACLFTLLAVLRRPLSPPPLAPTLALGVTQTALFLALSTWALAGAAAGKVAILVFTMPFWTLLMARYALGERVAGSQWAAIVLAFAGLLLILEPWSLKGALGAKVLAVAAGAVWAASAVVARRIHARHRIDVLALTAWQMLTGAGPLALLALLVPERPLDWQPAFVAALLFHSVITTALGWLLWLYILHHLPAGAASLNTLAIPVIAIAAGWLQLGERPTIFEAAGMVLAALALALLSFRALARQSAPK
jgi:drug/metabolite transporter (DMT)-like permease